MSLLDAFTEAGVLSALERHVCRTLARLSGDDREDVLLGVALAVRAPRHGHICVDLVDARARHAVDSEPSGAPEPAGAPDAPPAAPGADASPDTRDESRPPAQEPDPRDVTRSTISASDLPHQLPLFGALGSDRIDNAAGDSGAAVPKPNPSATAQAPVDAPGTAPSTPAPRSLPTASSGGGAAHPTETPPDLSALPWPDPDAWRAALSSSPLVRGPDEPRDTPLVLDHAGRLYLDRYWRYQERLVAQLRARAEVRLPVHDPDLLRRALDRLFPPSGPEPDHQRLAALMSVLRGFTVISGGPGTGKTTVVRKVLALLLEQRRAARATAPDLRPLRIALAAPTGKAAARMKEAVRDGLDALDTPEPVREALRQLEASTLHRLLGFHPGSPTRFRHHAGSPLPYDVVVVDEASMIDFALMSKLVDAVPSNARLVLLGDRHQLASVEAGAVLGDICGDAGLTLSREFAREIADLSGAASPPAHADTGSLDDSPGAPFGAPFGATLVDTPGIGDCIAHLTRFYRFGVDSGIGAIARAVHAGEDRLDDTLAYLRGQRTEPDASGPYRDLAWHGPARRGELPGAARTAIVEGYTPLIRAALDDAPAEHVLSALDRFRVLCAHRRGKLGVDGLNRSVERWLADHVGAFDPSDRWYVGRPVLVLRNDYALRLFNGDIGVVVRDPEAPRRRVVAFPSADGAPRLVGTGRLPPHETVFAMTIHKSQGSQFGHALVVLPDRVSPLLTRELVYTGVTRARDRLSLVGSEAILRAGITARVQRASGLGDALRERAAPAVRQEPSGQGSSAGSSLVAAPRPPSPDG